MRRDAHEVTLHLYLQHRSPQGVDIMTSDILKRLTEKLGK